MLSCIVRTRRENHRSQGIAEHYNRKKPAEARHRKIWRQRRRKFAKCAQSVKEFVDAAVKASPEASLVWPGVCVALPLLTNPQAASEANKSGFHYVTSRLAYYLKLEHLLWPVDGCEE